MCLIYLFNTDLETWDTNYIIYYIFGLLESLMSLKYLWKRFVYNFLHKYYYIIYLYKSTTFVDNIGWFILCKTLTNVISNYVISFKIKKSPCIIIIFIIYNILFIFCINIFLHKNYLLTRINSFCIVNDIVSFFWINIMYKITQTIWFFLLLI